MKDAIEMNIKGLKCDNPNCDYIDMSIKVEKYKEYLNSKCPKCGEILLTEADYRNTKFLLKFVHIINKILPKGKDDEVVSTMTVNMNGSGNMDFKIEDKS